MDRTLLGSLVILVGVILLLENIGPEVGIRNVGFARLWPLVLVAYGLATMFRRTRGSSDIWIGGLIAAVGAVFLAETLLSIDIWTGLGFVIRRYWPVAVILFGIHLIVQDRHRS